jgi:SSS family solute:Na+ symporter
MNALATVTHRNLATVDLIIIGVYFLGVFSIGLYFARKERTSTDYFLASRDIGWFFIGTSLFVRPEPRAGQV